ncbi:hypothetical protein BCR34DRAFT_550470 [Clohesyomyces aquaticus]|uniref:Rhodopsin domain-containing protein n=1 Tax=Clohesyomyces aquaticus TaxID=1231657 RepID=A0A1Y1Y823_9PLEO|nr:hypothetical protein BCR34DRAFT_550470 [Clohesyomyces aquaticus]
MPTISKPAAIVIFFCVVLIVACFVALTLRFLAMRTIRRPMKIHDYLCIISVVFCTAYCIDISIGTVYGDIGKHMTEVSLPRLTVALKTFFVSQFFWALSITGFRLSTLFVYIEIFTVGTFFYYAYGMVVIVSLFFVGSITTTLRLCRPINFSWDKTVTGTCGDIGTAELAASALNLSLDIIIVLLPLPLVWGLNMAKQRKIGLTVTFALGLVISAMNLGRIIQVKRCDIKDFTYCTHTAILLTVPEMAVGIIVACVPLLGPLIFPSRYKEPATSKYANLRDNSTKQRSTLHSVKATTESLEQSTQSFEGPNVESIELTGEAGKGHTHKAWAYSETVPRHVLDTDAAGDWIGVEREFKVTTKTKPAHT